MTDILPPAGWPNVRQLETNEFATGGANGNMNEQAKSLAARSELLKQYASLPYESKTGGYALNERVQLATGDIVRSAIPSNVNNPNVDMTGWGFDDNTVESIADLLAIQNPKNGQVVFVKQYYSDQIGRGANCNYTYDALRLLEDDGCTVIRGWVSQTKQACTVWDFGYKVGDVLKSNIAIKNAIQSDVPIQLNSETLETHTYNDIVRTGNKTIFGCGKSLSIIKALRITAKDGSFICKGFKIAENGLNYAIYIANYDQVFVDDFEGEINYDTLLITAAKSDSSKAVVQNSVARKSARIGFTSDLLAKNVSFINCDAYDSRQGFHGELVTNTYYKKCRAIRCGNDAPTPTTDQPTIYAGGFRFHDYKNVVLEDCENIDKAGQNIDCLGGGGTDLTIIRSKGFGLITDDVNETQPEDSFTYTNITVNDAKDFFIQNQLSKSIISGRVYISETVGGDIDLLGKGNSISKDNAISSCIIENITCGRLQISTNITGSNLILSGVKSSSKYWNAIRGFEFHNIGDIEYDWLEGDESQFPTLGYRFIGNNAKTFTLQSFTSIGRGGGSQISLESLDPLKFKGGYIGLLSSVGVVDMFANLDFNKFKIVMLKNLGQKTVQTNSANLISASDPLNIYNKFFGKEVFNLTTSKFMKAVGENPTSPWVYLDGTANIFPV